MAVLEHSKHGATVRCDKCVCQNGIWLVPCEGGATCETPMGYLKGNKPPNYPVPAIRRRVKYSDLWSVLRWIGYLPSGFPRF